MVYQIQGRENKMLFAAEVHEKAGWPTHLLCPEALYPAVCPGHRGKWVPPVGWKRNRMCSLTWDSLLGHLEVGSRSSLQGMSWPGLTLVV